MSKKNSYFFILCIIACFFASEINYAQDEASNWFFGKRAGVNFDNDSVTFINGGAIQTNEGCASISSASGDLLFYTDGILVWDKNHNVMPNGSGLFGDKSSTQSAIIVPKPNTDNIYYIITVINGGRVYGVRYSEVDMTLNNGNGDINSNKNISLSTPSAEKISVVKHANGNDYWLATHGWKNNVFSVFKITDLGIESTPVNSSLGSYHGTVDFNAIGYMKFSPNGKRLALAKWSNNSTVEVFDFDSSTGVVSNSIVLDEYFGDDYINGAYGIEFSPNSNLLYVSEINLDTSSSKLHQLNLSNFNKTAILDSDTIIFDGNDILAALQLGLDGKIYVCRTFNRYLNVIEDPNVIGLGCNYSSGAISLGNNSAVYGLPSFIQSLFVASIEIDNSCLNSSTQFSIKTDEPIDDVVWDFGDTNTSDLESPKHNYLSSGEYLVKAKVTSGDCTINVSKNVVIYETPVANKANDYIACYDTNKDGFEIFDLSDKTIEILGLQLDSEFYVSYFESFYNAENNINALNLRYTNKSAGQEIFARIQNRKNTECYDISSFLLIVDPKIVGTIEDFLICDDISNDGTEIIDLSQFDNQVASLTPIIPHNDCLITYHNTLTQAEQGVDALPKNYQTKSNNQNIYVRFENKNTGCFDTTQFKIIINAYVIAHQPLDMYVCDDALNDGKALFNLALQKPDILKTQRGKVTFHVSQTDADSGDSPIDENYENDLLQQEIFVRAENLLNATCYGTTSFFVEVMSQPTAGNIADYIICDDPSNDGKEFIDLSQFDAAVYNGQSLTDYTVTYHESESDAEMGTQALPSNYESTSQELFARIATNSSRIVCYNVIKFNIIIDDALTAHKPSNMYLCDDALNDGKELFDLASQKPDILKTQRGKVTFHVSQADADSGDLPLDENYENELIRQEIFVRAENSVNAMCYDTTSFFIEVNSRPIIDIDKTWYLCPGEDVQVYLNSVHDSYLWSNGTTGSEITIDKSGMYSVTVFNIIKGYSECSVTETIQVLDIEIPKSYEVTTKDWTTNENSIQIEVDGTENYLFSIDGDVYQSSNTFNNLEAGDYIVYVKNETDCLLYSEEVYLLNYPKFFTPNNDGYNDYWKINFSEKEPQTEVHIFDRYGKLIIKLNATSSGWDGTLNGQLLATSDYWFIVNRPSKNKKYKGHFTLKR